MAWQSRPHCGWPGFLLHVSKMSPLQQQRALKRLEDRLHIHGDRGSGSLGKPRGVSGNGLQVYESPDRTAHRGSTEQVGSSMWNEARVYETCHVARSFLAATFLFSLGDTETRRCPPVTVRAEAGPQAAVPLAGAATGTAEVAATSTALAPVTAGIDFRPPMVELKH
jgi:hypothetical protein